MPRSVLTTTLADDLNAAVETLLRPRRSRLWRDGGETVWADVPSLWDQLGDALVNGGGEKSDTRMVPGSRLPADVDILDLLDVIRTTVTDAAGEYGLLDRPDLPSRLTGVAAALMVDAEDDVLRWWAHQVRSWCRQAQFRLGQITVSQPRRIRDTACPACQQTHVLVDSTDSTERTLAPALLIDFSDGMVRAAECSACGMTWWRGEQLWQLADLIAYQRVRDTPAAA